MVFIRTKKLIRSSL